MLVWNGPVVPSRLDLMSILIYIHFQRTISKLTLSINDIKKLVWKVQNHYMGQELSEQGLQLRLDRNLNHLMLSSHKKQVYESHTVSWSTFWHQHKVKICIFYTPLFVQSRVHVQSTRWETELHHLSISKPDLQDLALVRIKVYFDTISLLLPPM